MIGQKYLQSRVHSMVRLGKLPRFIILVGEFGSGRRTFTKWLADDLDAQFVEVARGVDDVRSAIATSYKVSEKVLYFFADADMMSQAAKSALLKVTEEPPRSAYFVISTSDTARLMDTLVSRASVFAMESYSTADLTEFVADDIENIDVYTRCCNNGYEVQLVKGYGAKEFSDFTNLVVDNIAEVDGSNALKMEGRIAFKAEDKGFDVKIFLQAFRAECMRRIRLLDDKTERGKFIEWIKITSERLQELQIQAINKQAVFDMWIFDVREASFNAEG